MLGFYQLWAQFQRNATHPCFPVIAIFTWMHLWEIFNRIKVSQSERSYCRILLWVFSRVKYKNVIFYSKKPHIFISKQYSTGACCHGNQKPWVR